VQVMRRYVRLMCVCIRCKMSQLPPEFDEFHSTDYDPQYTADVSTHMYVPDHIDVTGSDDSMSLVQLDDRLNNHAAQMTVPDKIIILGLMTHLITV